MPGPPSLGLNNDWCIRDGKPVSLPQYGKLELLALAILPIVPWISPLKVFLPSYNGNKIFDQLVW